LTLGCCDTESIAPGQRCDSEAPVSPGGPAGGGATRRRGRRPGEGAADLVKDIRVRRLGEHARGRSAVGGFGPPSVPSRWPCSGILRSSRLADRSTGHFYLNGTGRRNSLSRRSRTAFQRRWAKAGVLSHCWPKGARCRACLPRNPTACCSRGALRRGPRQVGRYRSSAVTRSERRQRSQVRARRVRASRSGGVRGGLHARSPSPPWRPRWCCTRRSSASSSAAACPPPPHAPPTPAPATSSPCPLPPPTPSPAPPPTALPAAGVPAAAAWRLRSTGEAIGTTAVPAPCDSAPPSHRRRARRPPGAGAGAGAGAAGWVGGGGGSSWAAASARMLPLTSYTQSGRRQAAFYHC
jgi:hypothetical protein